MEQEPKSSEWREKMIRWIRYGIPTDVPLDPLREYKEKKQKMRSQICEHLYNTYGIYNTSILDKDETGENGSYEPGFIVKVVFHDPSTYINMIQRLKPEKISSLKFSETKHECGYPDRVSFEDIRNCSWEFELKAIVFPGEWN
jgi:hypothetical protein